VVVNDAMRGRGGSNPDRRWKKEMEEGDGRRWRWKKEMEDGSQEQLGGRVRLCWLKVDPLCGQECDVPADCETQDP